MAEMIPAGYGKATFVFTASGITKELTSSIGVQLNAAVDFPEYAAYLYDRMVATGNPAAPGTMNVAWVFQGVDMFQQGETDFYTFSYRVPSAGTVASWGTPVVNTSYLINKNATAGGRRNRGRMFWPPATLNETFVNQAGTLEGGSQAAEQGRWDLMVDAFEGGEMTPVILHSAAGLPTPIVSFSVGSTVATQRRRLR